MAIDFTRRRFIGSLVGSCVGSSVCWGAPIRAASNAITLAGSWKKGNAYEAGLVRITPTTATITACVALPTRAHQLLPLADGSIIIASRRPGDWLMRWWPHSPERTFIRWMESMQRLNGHMCLLADGRRLATTQTDAADDVGYVVVHQLCDFAPLARWPSGGRDPHQILVDVESSKLWVANGGRATRFETGRTIDPNQAIDSSVVELDAHNGALLRRFRVDDPNLSLRHIAYHAPTKTLGVAMQAHHKQQQQHAVPVFASISLGNPTQRHTVLETPLSVGQARQSMRGYAGSIVSHGAQFWLSSPKGGVVGLWNAGGTWVKQQRVPNVCALAITPLGLCMGGKNGIHIGGGAAIALDVEPDNHWSLVG